MFSFIRKAMGTDPLSLTIIEFQKIIELEKKRKKLEHKFDDTAKDSLIVQKNILTNNLRTLSRVFNSQSDKILDIDKDEYFNIQGSNNEVFKLSNPKNTYLHKKTGIETPVIELREHSDKIEEIFRLERKFSELSQGKIKNKVYSKILNIAREKINSKIIDYCNLFKGNEELTRKFVFSNMTKTDEDYHNELLVYQRINFLGYLVETYGPDIFNSELIDIDSKGLIQITFNNSINNIEAFLKEFKGNKFDYILTIRK